MDARHLGWAGVELRDGDDTIVIDPLADAGAVWAAFGDRSADVPLPPTVAAGTGAAAGLVTHLHRDHADAAALAAALEPGAPVLVPAPYGGSDLEELGLAQAAYELGEAGLTLRTVQPWEELEVGGWSITALPAADGTGDPQVSWLVRRGGASVVHAGDTLMHGWWWRIAERAGEPVDVAFLPINAARVTFPHRRPAGPLPAVMGPAEAAVAGRLLRARTTVPIHYGGYTFPPVYVPDEDALDGFRRAAADQDIDVAVPDLGEWFGVRAGAPA